MPTYREEYFRLKKLDNKKFSDEVIFSLFLDIGNFTNKTDITLHFDDQVFDAKKFSKYIEKIDDGIPYQYVIGYTEFCGYKYYVNHDVLIPRQETEQLVKNVIDRINKKFHKPISVLDMCCGSGCIGISVKMNVNSQVFLVDISENALKMSQKNCELHKTKCEIVCSDLFSNISYKNKFDVIVCNPPYIEDVSGIDEHTWKYEPHIALLANPSTLFYEKIFIDCKDYLSDEFLLAFEIGEDMKEKLIPLVEKHFPKATYNFEKDIYNKDRFLYIVSKYE